MAMIRPVFCKVRKFWREEEGATAIEYALIAALVGLALVVSLTDLGQAIVGVFEDIAAELSKSV